MGRSVSSWFALVLCPIGAFGCVKTTTSERDVGTPTTHVVDELLPGPPHLEALAFREDETLRLELWRSLTCRRRTHTTVDRVREEHRQVSVGSGIAGGVVIGLGILSVADGGVVLILIGTGILAIAGVQTGQTTTALPSETSVGRASEVRCHRSHAAGAEVLVVSGGVTQRARSNSEGRVELSGIGPGPLRVVVDGRVVTVHEQAERPRPVEAPTPQAPESSEPSETPTAPPTAPAKPSPSTRPSAPLPLPPQPPPPPGTRIDPR